MGSYKQLLDKLTGRNGKSALGLVITAGRIAAAKIKSSNGSYRLVRSGEYILPADKITGGLEAYGGGDGFAEFLTNGHFKSRRVFVGIEAKYLMTTTIELPAVKNETMLNDMVRIGLEKKLMLDLNDISFDYCPSGHDGVMVIATLGRHIDDIGKFLSGCGLVLSGVTSTSLSIDFRENEGVNLHVVVFDDYVDIVSAGDAGVKALRHVAAGKDADEVLPEITRNLILLSGGENGVSAAVIWNYSSGPFGYIERLRDGIEGAGVPVKAIKNSGAIPGGVEGITANSTPLPQLAAVIAHKGLRGKGLVELLHGHAPDGRQQKPYRKHASKIAAGLALFVLLVGGFLFSWHLDRKEIARLEQDLNEISGPAEDAKKAIMEFDYLKQWLDTEPVYLDILRQLTLAFPEKEGIWLSTMAVDESTNQVITGKATDDGAVQELLTNLRKNAAFGDVRMLYIRAAGRNTNIVNFAISLKAARTVQDRTNGGNNR